MTRTCARLSCATACETMANGDTMLVDCAKACRVCADMCMTMSKSAKAA